MTDIVYFDSPGHEAHAEPGHPERPARMDALREGLQELGLWDPFPHLDPAPIPEGVQKAVHDPSYLETLRMACREGKRLDADTYTTPASYELALDAAGGALAVARAVWRGDAQRGFALTRPPGHHATPTRGMGFCLLNNVALAAEDLLQNHGARRLAIIDLDLHHGNGTQDVYWQRGEVFFFSIHQSPLYPGTGALSETGAGAGAGTNANFPLPPASGDEAFRSFLAGLILPLLDRFAPEMLLVSFGFDPHWRDPLGHLRLSAAANGEVVAGLTAWADEHCGGRIALFLEGGYDLEAGRACGQAVTAALLGRPWADSLGPSPRPEGASWRSVYRQARTLWGLD